MPPVPRLAPPGEWEQTCDGAGVLPILRTLPATVIGPGHNSVVRGPDNQQLFCVYHRWAPDGSGRQLAIDPLDWAGERMLVLGPSIGPQPAPLRPAVEGFGEGEAPDERWHLAGGRWRVQGGTCEQEEADGRAEATLDVGAPFFVMEVSLRAPEPARGSLGVTLQKADGTPSLALQLVPEGPAGRLTLGETAMPLALPSEFDPHCFHLLRVEVNGRHVRAELDERPFWEGWQAEAVSRVALATADTRAAFAGLAVTLGWQDEWMEQSAAPTDLGWRGEGADEAWQIAQQLLWHTSLATNTLAKGPLLDCYEMTVNVRLDEADSQAGYAFLPALRPDGSGPCLALAQRDGRWHLDDFELLPSFDPWRFQQFRFRREGSRLTIQWEAVMLGEITLPPEPTQVGIQARGRVAFDMVRVTAGGTGIIGQAKQGNSHEGE